MNVKDLQHFLHSLSQPLIAAGAKKAADDLDRACAARLITRIGKPGRLTDVFDMHKS